ncbi:probable phytanoyl-CoA dioxygenase isoform X2 [Orussus abietinus]|nr:probable phytanoyl-CoA dioxygenase isoform X2 [Orussus abietinus]
MSKLSLTRDTGRFSTAQRIFYEDNGYLLLPRLVPLDLLEKCSQRFDDIASGKVDHGNMTVMRDVKDRSVVVKVQDLNFDGVFKEYIKFDQLLDAVEPFTGPNVMAMHSMYIAKPPDSGSGSSWHPPHQDLYYFPFRPADRIVAAWTAIEPATKENGCLQVSPGSHRAFPLLPHEYPPNTVNKFYHGIQKLPNSILWLDLEMQPGDTILFHPLLIHSSGINRTTRTRRSISCHYAAAECSYIEVKGTVQEVVSDEILSVLRRRFPGAEIKYDDVWRMKSTIVRGIRSSL